jgi:hypothetical protein
MIGSAAAFRVRPEAGQGCLSRRLVVKWDNDHFLRRSSGFAKLL